MGIDRNGSAAVREQSRHERQRQLEKQRRIEHAIRVNSEDGICEMTSGQLVERFATFAERIHRIARALGINVPSSDEVFLTRRQLVGISNMAGTTGGLPRCRTWQQSKFHSSVGEKKAEKRISGDEAYSRIPDGGARETIRERMRPHPCAEVT